jgi:hypothetical protein
MSNLEQSFDCQGQLEQMSSDAGTNNASSLLPANKALREALLRVREQANPASDSGHNTHHSHSRKS